MDKDKERDLIATAKSLKLTREEILALDGKYFTQRQKEDFIAALFGPVINEDMKAKLLPAYESLKRWTAFLSSKKLIGSVYKTTHQQLLAQAKLKPPKSRGRAVTNFTDWIYRLYIPHRDYAALRQGARVEREIELTRIPLPANEKWSLIYNGMGDSLAPALSISELEVDGSPMFGKPDLVFREKRSGRILIVEIKATEADIYADGWPNLRAQLWAYSKIDQWKDVNEVILVGEIWGYRGGIRRRATLRWIKGDAVFERENAELFDLYKSDRVVEDRFRIYLPGG